MFALCAGFVNSQVLFACVRGGIVDALQERPLSLDQLAASSALPAERLAPLLEAGVALQLCARLQDGRFTLGELGAALCGNPGVQAMILHHSELYEDLADPLALIRDPGFSGRLQEYWAYARRADARTLSADNVAAYSGLMSASQDLLAYEVLDAVPLGRSQKLLDVGGGDGTFAIAAARRWPQLQITVADLPAVTGHAESRIRDAGLQSRIATLALDFHAEPLPDGHDHISLIRILHDHDDGPVRKLLAAAYRALAPGGQLLVAEPVADDSQAGRLLRSYFGMYLLAMGQGRLRTSAELDDLLRTAGFDAVRRHSARMPLVTSILTAEQKA